jgi:N-acetylmuramoyl-L-alanine amidase
MKSSQSIVISVLCSAMAVPLARAADSAQQLYREAQAKEQTMRAEADPPPSDWHAAIRAYEAIVRRYPTSGYSDNALWQAAGLARDLFAQTGDVREKARAARLLRALVSEYPSSKLVPAAVVDITSLAGAGLAAPSRPLQPAEAASAPPASKPLPARPTPPPDAGRTWSGPPASPMRTARVLVRAINRVVLPEVVRIVVELDTEVPFHHERLENPTRVFVDLQGTQLTPALRDAVLTYSDDIVRQVRIGRHPANTTRIVLDVTNLARYSFFTLYQPFRLVIDCERAPLAGVLSGSTLATSATGLLPSRPLVTTWTSSMPVVPSLAIAAKDDEPSRRLEATGVSVAALPAPLPPSANGRGGFSIARQLGLGASRIVIDPGHGGHDPGALKDRASEADLVLDIALRLEQLLLKQPGFEVVLTRRMDSYVALEERTAIANREGADLFLSIHANASGNANTRGVETYFLNFAATADAAAVAARENATSDRTMSSLPDLVKAITLSNKREESRDFAASVQRALFQRLPKAGMRNLGVRQAPFVVLIGAEMPSILTEVAFLTNRQDQQLLKSSSYRQLIAEALLSGILRYHQTLKSGNGRLAQQ